MEIDTGKLAPRILINEHDIVNKEKVILNAPITLMFGFSPLGRSGEMIVCNSAAEIYREFGFPTSSAEKYFIDSALRVVENNATAIMTRLPYDNFQSHNVKYIDYTIEEPISMRDISTGPSELQSRLKDDKGVTTLKEMHHVDPYMNQFQRISQKQLDDGNLIGSMSNEELIELDLDPINTLPENTIRIVDIRCEQYGVGIDEIEYSGIFPIFVSAPMALYYQGKIKNSSELDSVFKLLELEHGIEVSNDWYRNSSKIDDEYKIQQSKIISSIHQDINFDTSKNRFHRMESFQDNCIRNFPIINLVEVDKLSKTNLKDIGVLVCKLDWDNDRQVTSLSIVESFIGQPGYGIRGIDRIINKKSKYIRMYKNVSISQDTDFFLVGGQKLASIGMQQSECYKFINYKTSIIDPIQFMLDSIYSDIDSFQVDVILDAGISSTAFAAYVAKNEDGQTFKSNPSVRTLIDWARNEYPPEEYIEDYAFVWNYITKLFGDFIKNVRGDCVYIADGPRILNLERNYPIRNYTDMENIEMFNKFLPFFNGNTNNYVARYFNWVFIEDLQYENRGIWVPGSVVMGSQLAFNDNFGQVWYAPAGQQRGIVSDAYDVSVRTKQYTKENDIMYENNWNFFQTYQNEGVVVEGQKTLQTKKTSLDRLNVRRLVCYIKQQARIISNRYKYEPHTTSVRESYRAELISLLSRIQRTSGISDFFVICDSSNNTIETIDRHELWCKIGIKPIKAIEYIIIDLDIINGKVGMDDSKVMKS